MTIESVNATLPFTATSSAKGCTSIGTDIYLFSDNKIYKFDTLTNTFTTLATQTSGYTTNATSFNLNLYYGQVNEFKTKYQLQSNELQFITDYANNDLPFIASDTLELDISIGKAFIGNSNNKAEVVEIYQYQDSNWVKVV